MLSVMPLDKKNYKFALTAACCAVIPIEFGELDPHSRHLFHMHAFVSEAHLGAHGKLPIFSEKDLISFLQVPVKPSTLKLIRHFEQAGKEPYTTAYKDRLGTPTIATGFNLNRPDAKRTLEALLRLDLAALKRGEVVLKEEPTHFDELFEAIKRGKQSLTEEQALALEQVAIAETELLVVKKVGLETYNTLSQDQKDSLISLCFNSPVLVGRNLINALKKGNMKAVHREIRYESNPHGLAGVALRREREAKPFGG